MQLDSLASMMGFIFDAASKPDLMTEQQRWQEMEARMARLANETAVEKHPPVSEPPKPRVPNLTVESHVVPSVIAQPVAYSPPVKHDPPVAKHTRPPAKAPEPYLVTNAQRPIKWTLWLGIALFLLAVIAEVVFASYFIKRSFSYG